MLRRICSLLIDDESEQVLAYVIRHIDRTLQQSPGEAERPLGAPKAPDLIREGLAAIEQSCKSLYHYPFLTVDINKQRQYLHELSQSTAEPADVWTNIPQQVLFKKLLQLTVEAYYSHPAVWSEIGYAGPAYPRGYVRTQLGQLDPWEAQPET